jgi:hypothetical protein
MITITIRELCQWDRDGEAPEFVGPYSIYRFRDGDFILYVGKTERNIAERLWEHIGLGGQTQLTPLIEDNIPESLDWQVDLYTVTDCFPFIKEYLAAKVMEEWDVALAEKALIMHSSPAINSTLNYHPTELPERYTRKRLERARSAFSSYLPSYSKTNKSSE